MAPIPPPPDSPPTLQGGESDLTWPEARDLANRRVFESTGKHLTDLEIKVLLGSWEGQTYEEMADRYAYGAGYLNRDVGNALWKKLSQALQEKVSKTNFREALRRAWEKIPDPPRPNPLFSGIPMPGDGAEAPLAEAPFADAPFTEAPFVEGPVAPGSQFYGLRSGAEELGTRSLLKPGALVRVKAPSLMGKTSFLYYLLHEMQQRSYPTVYLDVGSVDRGTLTSLEKLLRWVCAMASRQLKIPNRLEDYWDNKMFGSNDNCTAYFEEYLLQELTHPVVLALDNVDRLFPHSEIVEDFFGLLRSWHEKARIAPLWQQLRLMLVHSTDVYIPLDYHQSPFNTGIPIELPEFSASQIQSLAQLHHLNLSEGEITALMDSIGGHPYLVRLALYELSQGCQSLGELLASAPSESGIYGSHLRRQWFLVQQSPDLIPILGQVMAATDPVSLSPLMTYKLHSMGLIQRHNNQVIPRCQVYRDYFQQILTHKP